MSDLMDTAEVAEFLKIKPDTVRWYHKRKVMPEADSYFGRTPVWQKQTIVDWQSKRKYASSKAVTPEAHTHYMENENG